MIDRIRDFRRELQERLADRSVATPHGVARLADAIPQVYDANYLSVEGAAAPAAVLTAEADEAMASRFHRRVVVEGGGSGLAGDFAELGYTLSTHLVLVHEREPDRRVDTSTVRAASLDELVPLRTRAILAEHWGDPEIAVQLNEAKRRIEAAVPTRFFAVCAGDEIAGYCEVRVLDGVAQIEDVEVIPEHRGHGLGRALVQHALDEALGAAAVVFLEALADDWPRELYAKLGFVVVDRGDLYTRLPHALTRLRVRSDGLELRLATDAELDPAGRAQQREALARWSAENWALPLVSFRNGAPSGVIRLAAEDFARRRIVELGGDDSTDVRAAALALAFDGLGAKLAGGRPDRPRPGRVEISGLTRLLPLFGAE